MSLVEEAYKWIQVTCNVESKHFEIGCLAFVVGFSFRHYFDVGLKLRKKVRHGSR